MGGPDVAEAGSAPPSDAEVRASIAAGLSAALTRMATPAPQVSNATRERRVARGVELAQIAAALGDCQHLSRGHRSPSSWLAEVTGESVGHCKATVTIITRLPEMPLIAAAVADGDLSESAVRLLADTWHPDIASVFARDEEMLLDWATQFTFADFKGLVEVWRSHADHDRTDDDASDAFARRSLHVSGLLDGMGRLDGTLDAEGHALVREALRALSHPSAGDTRTPAQRRADALVDLARIGLDAIADKGRLDVGEAPERRAKRNRPKIFAGIAYDELVAGHGAGVLDTNLDHTPLPASAIRRMACDAGIHRYVTSPDGVVLDHGRQHRVVTDAQFDRLMLRDHGCRFPGCHVPAAGCDAHHAEHWLDGGHTRDDNLALLCWHHHHLLHEQHWSLQPLGGGHFILDLPSGETLMMRPPSNGCDPTLL